MESWPSHLVGMVSRKKRKKKKMLYSYYYEGDRNCHVLLRMLIVANGTVTSKGNYHCLLIGFE